MCKRSSVPVLVHLSSGYRFETTEDTVELRLADTNRVNTMPDCSLVVTTHAFLAQIDYQSASAKLATSKVLHFVLIAQLLVTSRRWTRRMTRRYQRLHGIGKQGLEVVKAVSLLL
jgi:hypothetical protein